MKRIKLLTSVEDIILCEFKCGSGISSNTSCAWQRKKTSTHFPPIQAKKITERRGGGYVYRGALVPVRGTNRDQILRDSFGPGSCHEPGRMSPIEPGPMLHGLLAAQTRTNARHWSRFVWEPGLMTFSGFPKASFSTSVHLGSKMDFRIFLTF